MTIRAVIIEDEPLAVDRLRQCLAYSDDISLIGEAHDGRTAITLLEDVRPDVAFLDVRLPLLSGFEVLKAVSYKPAVIFTTAYDEYAVHAFEWGAFDYLLKPFDRNRIALSITRYKERMGLDESATHMSERIQVTESKEQLKRFFVKQRGVTIPIDDDSIHAIVAEGDYSRVHVTHTSYLVHLPLREFERRLSTAHFRRVHRSVLVHVARITRIDMCGRGATVLLENGLHVTASRAGLTHLKDLRL